MLELQWLIVIVYLIDVVTTAVLMIWMEVV